VTKGAEPTRAEPVQIIPEGRVVFGIQLPIQSQSTIYVEDWELNSGPAELARVARQAEDSGFLLRGGVRTTPPSRAGWRGP